MPVLDLSSQDLWNPKYLPALTRPKIYNILYGGAGPGKSQTMIQSFLSEILNHGENENETFVVLRKVAATIRTSVYMDFKNKIYEWNLGDLITPYDGIFEFRSRNNKIIFMGVKQ